MSRELHLSRVVRRARDLLRETRNLVREEQELYARESWEALNSAINDLDDAAVASAVLPSEPTACRRCSECPGMPHHWMDNDEAEQPGDPTHMCKHCDALGDECDTCGGYGEGGPAGSCGGCETCPPSSLCPTCKGIGVNERGRTPASTGKAGEG